MIIFATKYRSKLLEIGESAWFGTVDRVDVESPDAAMSVLQLYDREMYAYRGTEEVGKVVSGMLCKKGMAVDYII
jgi:hypothetical protein